MKDELAKSLGSLWKKLIIINFRRRKRMSTRKAVQLKYAELTKLLIDAYNETFKPKNFDNDCFQISIVHKINKNSDIHIKILYEDNFFHDIMKVRPDGSEIACREDFSTSDIIDLTYGTIMKQCARKNITLPEFTSVPLSNNSLYRNKYLNELIISTILDNNNNNNNS